jgi:hypothetical protein
MNAKTAVAITALNIVAVVASGTMLLLAKSERTLVEGQIAEATKDLKRAETSMLAAHSMLQMIEERVFKANLEWNERENKRVLDELQKKLAEDCKESWKRISELTRKESRTNETGRTTGR